MKYLIVDALLGIVSSCQVQNRKDNSKGMALKNYDFSQFLDLFDKRELPISIDSIFIENVVSRNNKKFLNNDFSQYLYVDELLDSCGTHPQFFIYPSIYFEDKNFYGLFLYLKLNEKCSFDIDFDRIFLITYKMNGELKGFKEVGSKQVIWDSKNLIYSNISNESKIYRTKIKMLGDIELEPTSTKIESDTIQIKMDGTIEN